MTARTPDDVSGARPPLGPTDEAGTDTLAGAAPRVAVDAPFDADTLAADGPPRAAGDAPDADTLAATGAPHERAARPATLTGAVARLALAGSDDYLIVGQFARGGIGRILQAHDPRLDRPVALKELLVHGRPVDEERFMREVLLTARLQHPGIVPVYAAGRWPSGAPFYAMKLVAGRSFDKVIAAAGSLAARLALLPHVLAIAETVAYAHSKRIIHRDLKPHNVLVGEFGETVVIDWGLAKELDAPDVPVPARAPATSPPAEGLTFVGAVVGTPGYMSPEQAGGEAVDERTDVYALGAILYHVLSGSLPFDASNPMNLVYKAVYEEPLPLRAREPDAPEELVAIVDKAMVKDPAKRYPSAREFAEDLRRFQTGQIVGAHRYTAWEHARRFIRKRRAVLSLAALSLVVVVAITAIGFSRVAAERDAAETARDDARDAWAEAERRADNLSCEQARLLVDTDPPEALRLLASVSPQADWRQTRQIAADLAQRGIPRALRGHRGAISRAAFSPDGAFLATTSDDCTLRVWDMAGRSSRAYYGHTDEVWRAAWSADMTRIATSSKDGTVRVWDLATGAGQVLHGGAQGVRNVAFSPDGRHVYAADASPTVRRWDLTSGAAEVVRDLCQGNSTRWTERWATCTDTEAHVVALIDLTTGRVRDYPLGAESSHSPSSAVSPDGRWLTSNTRGGRLWLWDRERDAGELLAHDDPGMVFSLREPRFSPGSDRLFAPADFDRARLRELATGAEQTLSMHKGYTRRGNFSADGDLLVTTGGDSNLGVWHASARASYQLPSSRAYLIDAQVSPDGRWIAAVGSDPRVFVWSPPDVLPTQYTVSAGASATTALAALSDSHLALLAEGGVEIVDRARLVLQHRLPIARAVRILGLSSAGGAAATLDDAGELVVWSLLDGRPLLRRSMLASTCVKGKLLADPEAARFALLCHDGPILWVDPAAADPVVALGSVTGFGLGAVLHGRSALVVGDASGELRVNDSPGAPLRRLSTYFGGIQALTALTRSGEFVVSSEDFVEHRDLTPTPLQRYRGHRLQANVVTISRDGRWLATFGRDNHVRVFDRETAALRIELFSPDLLHTGALSTDGARVAAIVNASEVLVWDIRGDPGDSARRMPRRIHVGAEVSVVAFDPDGALLALTAERAIRWRDDLPDDPDGLRRWLIERADLAAPPRSQVGCAAPEPRPEGP